MGKVLAITAEKYAPAYIDMTVICMGCEDVLYSGSYHPGIIGKINKLIRKAGWVHHPTEGTLCPDCQHIIKQRVRP